MSLAFVQLISSIIITVCGVINSVLLFLVMRQYLIALKLGRQIEIFDNFNELLKEMLKDPKVSNTKKDEAIRLSKKMSYHKSVKNSEKLLEELQTLINTYIP